MSVDTRFGLNQAIADNQLVLHYQPIVSVALRKVVAVEALVRWRHPTRGILPRAVRAPELLIAELPAATLSSPEQLDSLALMRRRGIRVAIDDVVRSAKEHGRSVTPVGIALWPERH